ncbi:MAG: permease-like cell division protein FtsX [candidate division KSB1 bacterium]|nr:permease-like cell division protein FtsX [candidate division KSB1 bacterium]MDQ7065477.1 permease-like cell division protein FtsX [candidate division KSB1 bacterium]
MRTLLFVLKESLSGIHRAKFSAALTILTVSISLLFVGIFYVGGKNVLRIVQEIRGRVGFEAFVDNTATEADIQRLQEQLSQIAGIDSIEYISREQAIEVFKTLFDDTFLNVVEENPLPASFQLFLNPAYVREDSSRAVLRRVAALPGIDEVVYRERVLQRLIQVFDTMRNVLIGLGALFGVLSFVLVSNNIRLTIAARRRIIETLELVGATRGMVWGPFVIQGILEGLIGGALAGMALWALLRVFSWLLEISLRMPPEAFLSLIALGLTYGFLGAMLTVQRRL